MINSVRNSVLTITNKNNYGYISPSDFNLLAQNAQMELYEEYFSNYNKAINAENLRVSGTDYANIGKAAAEALETFLVSDFLYHRSQNTFYLPSVTTTGDEAYMISKVMVRTTMIESGFNFGNAVGQLYDTSANFISAGVQINDIVINIDVSPNTLAYVTGIISPIQLTLSSNIFTAPRSEAYEIYSNSGVYEAEKITNGNTHLLVNSNLTSPSMIYPAYSNVSDYMELYPTSIRRYGNVKAAYFRYPKPPKWTYNVLSNGEPVFDQTQPDYQDFELPKEDEHKLVAKILQYCGIVIREAGVSQFGIAKEQQSTPSFSVQQ